MTSTASTTDTTTDKTPLTGYVILRQQQKPSANTASSMPTGGWEIASRTTTAKSAEAAVRAYVEKESYKSPVTLIAIPARSWRPLLVTPKVTTSLDIKEA